MAGRTELKADLVLEGGGVKGIGLVGAVSVLERKGYAFPRVAGTSAGAIVGAMVAAGIPAGEMELLMRTVDYERFADEGAIDRLGALGKGLSLMLEKGIYEGAYLVEWLGGILKDHGIETFGDLRLPRDAGTSLPPSKRYRLVVMAADLSRGRLVRFPWDYKALYGKDPDEQRVVDAVRASMSIPFFYEPVKMRNDSTGIESLLVDGGLLSNFPVAVFDRTDGERPRWPTFGIKLSARADARQVRNDIGGPLSFAKALAATCVSGHDQVHIDDPCVQDRTIFVDTFKIPATKFDLSRTDAKRLYDSGAERAERFLKTWRFERHIKKCRTGAPA